LNLGDVDSTGIVFILESFLQEEGIETVKLKSLTETRLLLYIRDSEKDS
jgi:hypothetical protein